MWPWSKQPAAQVPVVPSDTHQVTSDNIYELLSGFDRTTTTKEIESVIKYIETAPEEFDIETARYKLVYKNEMVKPINNDVRSQIMMALYNLEQKRSPLVTGR
jgi:hypothetical protein